MEVIFSSSFCAFYKGECFCTLPGLIKMFFQKHLSIDAAGRKSRKRPFAFSIPSKKLYPQAKGILLGKNNVMIYKNKNK
jgi:hypothetical protein